MTTFGHVVDSDNWENIVDELSLEFGKGYFIQNMSDSILLFSYKTTQPIDGDPFHFLMPSDTKKIFINENFTFWIKAKNALPKKITISVSEDRTIISTEDNGGVPINIQDQTTPPLLIYFNKEITTTVLAADTVIGNKTFTVNDPNLFAIGNIASLFNQVAGYFSYGLIVDVTGQNITIDTPIDLPYFTGMLVSTNRVDLNIDGSTTPQVFSLRGSDPGLGIVGDVTRLHFQMTTDTQCDFGKFGDILGGLDFGCVIRKNLGGGLYQNILNVRLNSDLSILTGVDTTFFDAAKQGVYGLAARLTFAGQNKIGVALRIQTHEDLELVIQDDLTSLIGFRIMIQGHVLQY